jgi:hypothetical protein
MAKDVLITPIDGIIQFSASDGDGTGQIKVDGDDLVISNLVGDVLLGDGASDVFIGNGSDNVDIVFEQNGEIRDDGSGKTITIGSATTTLILSSSSDITLQGGGGNVGIGTTTAGEQLEVIGNISASGFVSASAFGGDGSALTNVSSTPTTGTISSSAQIVESLPFGTSGIFSASAAGSSQGKFKLNGVDVDVNGLGTNGDVTFDTLILDAGGLKGVGAFSSSAQFASEDILLGNITASNISASGNLFIKGDGTFGMGSSNPSVRVQNIDDSIGWNFATKATIHSYFNPQTPATTHFGIKTTTPSVALEVAGDISASGALYATNISASSTLKIDSDDDILLQAKSEIYFRSGSTNYARFDAPSGALGIGTSTPGNNNALLTVAGNVSSSGAINTLSHITASGNYSGSATSTFVIGGKLQAGSKSFLIPTPEGGKLEYGALEGPQNDVFFRGELKGDDVIYLPREWEWLVDENTITTQLTSIGKHQELYFKEIKENKIFIDINGILKTKENIHCYYIIHGTRKDIELIRNYQ